MNIAINTVQLHKSWSRQSAMNTFIVLGSEGFYGYDNQPNDKTCE